MECADAGQIRPVMGSLEQAKVPAVIHHALDRVDLVSWLFLIFEKFHGYT